MTQYAYIGGAPPSLSSPARRGWILLNILALHILVIGGPWFWMWAHGKLVPPKENRFKVKLGELTPSHAPEVGPPERTRPTAAPPAPATPAPPEPAIQPPKKAKPAPPEPKITRPKPKAVPQPKEPKVGRPKQKAAPQPKEPKITRSTAKTTGKSKNQSQRQSQHKNPQDQVYQPPGGWNFNPNVKIGTHDRGQVKGPADHKTPQGGLTQEEAAYYAALKKFLDFRWVEPSRTVLGDLRPTAVLELTIAADGRVLGARIVESSGNVSMDASVRRLIKVLDRVPVPPNGQLTILVDMEVK